MAEPGTLHHAPDFQDGTLVACGRGTVSYVKANKDVVTCDPPSQFIQDNDVIGSDVQRCPDCLRELTAKATRDDTPTSGGVLTSELPKSQPE